MAKRTGPEDEAWSDYAGELAANLRRLRAEAGLSQEDVAYRSASIHRWGGLLSWRRNAEMPL